MSFKDRRRRASFRGVPFVVDARDWAGGRRGPDHEYPFDDRALPEDLGRAKRQFTVQALVIGDDYDRELERLVEALEAPGPGDFVDRTAGRVFSVQVRTFTVRETSREAGLARVQMVFVEAGSPRAPTAAQDTRTAVDAAADAVAGVAAADLAGAWRVTGLPDWVAAEATAVVDAAAEALRAGLGGLSAALPVVGEATATVAAMASDAAPLVTATDQLGAGVAARVPAAIAACGTASGMSQNDI